MNFTAYIESQKNIIRNRRKATFIFEDGEVIAVPDRDKLLAELNSMKGLNVDGRMCHSLRRGV